MDFLDIIYQRSNRILIVTQRERGMKTLSLCFVIASFFISLNVGWFLFHQLTLKLYLLYIFLTVFCSCRDQWFFPDGQTILLYDWFTVYKDQSIANNTDIPSSVSYTGYSTIFNDFSTYSTDGSIYFTTSDGLKV